VSAERAPRPLPPDAEAEAFGSAVVLDRAFYDRPSLEVAPQLIGKLLAVADGRMARIVEVEAYAGGDDPGSHAYRGRTARNAAMFGPPGGLYVYFTYGMHWCANAVCGPGDIAQAVLLRAAAPVAGVEAMRAARWRAQRSQVDRDLCRGPGRLCQALGIDRTHDGGDLVTGVGGVTVLEDGWRLTGDLGVSTRIGLSAGADRPWRYFVRGSPWVSGRSEP
jgi:DNA-3-methyladenine glycosylase